ncbi:hypothetical protein GIS00_18850 [Nakamurella sp. YIM 132087]|uniref:OmpR/PhoB-type domain-containing protein n=1 Tax=Nakamurella alba TaxID=2665158 RepID=A0A7K1FRK8_9ACTN|nr:BTAD domain-containing putative transcriptional regulator [Nakamurella alba]MTD15999.1 hypothetical protein [Nakamurella alba]
MDFRDLGPLQVENEGIPVRLTGRRLLSVLAVLVARQGDVVTVDGLIDAVWDGAPPDRAEAALDSLLWRLRKALEPARAPRDPDGLLRTEAAGYRLEAGRGEIDSAAFAREAAAATDALRAGDHTRALDISTRALGRWRGRPYDGISDAGWIAAARERLEAVRIDLAEIRIGALLVAGRPEEAVADLVPLIDEYPFREHLRAQHMLGLYRSGRQAEALAAYAGARQVLDAELGVEPGPELVAMHAAVLGQDPALDLPRKAAPAGPVDAGALSGTGLPARRVVPIGRAAESDAVTAAVRPGRLLTLVGPMGVGKTTLAIACAAGLVDDERYPDGVHLADLSAVADPAAVAGELAAALGLTLDPGSPARSLAASLAGRRALLVVDNCEQLLPGIADLVAGILSTAVDLAVLATSREELGVPGETVVRIQPFPVPGGAGADSPGVALFLDRSGLSDDAADAGDIAEVVRICAALDGLPLGIELAARRARFLSLAEVAAGVEAEPGALTRDPRSPRPDRTLHDGIEVSHRTCRPDEQVLHRRLSALSAPFTLGLARAVAGNPPLAADLVPDLAAALAGRSLLAVEPSGRPGAPTRFRQLLPIRAHAADALRAAGEMSEIVGRRDAHVVALVADGPRRGRPGQRTWYEALDADRASVGAAIESLLTAPDGDPVALLLSRLAGYVHDRNHAVEARRWLVAADRHPGLSEFGAATAAAALGCSYAIARDNDRAADCFARAEPVLLAAADGVADDGRAVDAAGALLDMACAAWLGDDWARAVGLATVAADRCRAVGADHEAMIADAVLIAGGVFADPAAGVAAAEALLARPGADRNGLATLFACGTAAIGSAMTGDPEAAVRWTGEALRCSLAIGAENIGGLLEQRGGHLVRAGRPVEALRCFGAAAAHDRRVGLTWPQHPTTPPLLSAARAGVGDQEADQAWSAGERVIAAGRGLRLTDWI